MMVSPGGGIRVCVPAGAPEGATSLAVGLTGLGAAGESVQVDLLGTPLLGTLQPMAPNWLPGFCFSSGRMMARGGSGFCMTVTVGKTSWFCPLVCP